MEVIDYNGEGFWSRAAIIERYTRFAAEAGVAPRDLSPEELTHRGRKWIYPVLQKVIEGIEAGDPACVRIGVEFIEEDAKFPFGKILKSNTARALRRATLTTEQQQRVRHRVFGLLRAGHVPHEYREYAKLVRKIGFDLREVPEVNATNLYAARFRSYFERAAQSSK